MMRVTPLFVVGVVVFCLPALAGPELKKTAVLQTMQRAMPDLLACGAGVSETVTARFTIKPDGTVRGVQVGDGHAKDDLGRCLKKQIVALKFARSSKPTPVTFPFSFGASAAAQPTAVASRLSRKDLDGLLQILEADLKQCGDGVVSTSFTIEPTGRTGEVQVDDVDQKTGECVSKRIARVRFPSAERPTAVTRSFSLSDEG